MEARRRALPSPAGKALQNDTATARIISIIDRPSTNPCGAFLILRQWFCANPRVLVCMVVIATVSGCNPGDQIRNHGQQRPCATLSLTCSPASISSPAGMSRSAPAPRCRAYAVPNTACALQHRDSINCFKIDQTDSTHGCIDGDSRFVRAQDSCTCSKSISFRPLHLLLLPSWHRMSLSVRARDRYDLATSTAC